MSSNAKKIPIHGTLFRQLLARRNVTQKRIADITGMSRHHLCRLATDGQTSFVFEANAKALAEALEVDIGELSAGDRVLEVGLTADERELLAMYDALDPRARARCMIAVEEIWKSHHTGD